MKRQWVGVAVFGVFVVAAPFLASGLWQRGVNRPIGYATGFALILLGALVMRFLGGIPDTWR